MQWGSKVRTSSSWNEGSWRRYGWDTRGADVGWSGGGIFGVLTDIRQGFRLARDVGLGDFMNA